MGIKFQKFYVTDGAIKARVWYSEGVCYLNGPGKPFGDCVTIYAKDYGGELGRIFASDLGATYQNDTDSMSDYFDEGRVRIKPDSPYYAEVLARCRRNVAERIAAREKRQAAAQARLMVSRSIVRGVMQGAAA